MCTDKRCKRQRMAVDLLRHPYHRRVVLRAQSGAWRPQRVSISASVSPYFKKIK